MAPGLQCYFIGNKILNSIKNVIIERVTMFSFQQYHFHFDALTEKENVILFVDWTRLLSMSILPISKIKIVNRQHVSSADFYVTLA